MPWFFLFVDITISDSFVHYFNYKVTKHPIALRLGHKSAKIIYYCTYCSHLHREIVPPRETVAIARVAIAIVGRGG